MLEFMVGFALAGTLSIVTLYLAREEEKEKVEKNKYKVPKCKCSKCKYCESIEKNYDVIQCELNGRTQEKSNCKYYERINDSTDY